GIITPASKDREWIFYEAGAAFGRASIYMPLLVDASTDDLPTSIADYQACRASDREDVERSLSELATKIGCEMRQQFRKRFSRFQRRLDDHRRGTEGVGGAKDQLDKAIDAYIHGRGEEADAILEEREAEVADDPNELTKIKVFRLQVNDKLKPVDILAE